MGHLGLKCGSKWQKGCFHNSHFTTNPDFPKNTVLNSQHSSPNTLCKLKDELTDLNKTLQKLPLDNTKKNLSSESLTVIHENYRAKLQLKLLCLPAHLMMTKKFSV